jgi:hypothetical protein
MTMIDVGSAKSVPLRWVGVEEEESLLVGAVTEQSTIAHEQGQVVAAVAA